MWIPPIKPENQIKSRLVICVQKINQSIDRPLFATTYILNTRINVISFDKGKLLPSDN